MSSIYLYKDLEHEAVDTIHVIQIPRCNGPTTSSAGLLEASERRGRTLNDAHDRRSIPPPAQRGSWRRREGVERANPTGRAIEIHFLETIHESMNQNGPKRTFFHKQVLFIFHFS